VEKAIKKTRDEKATGDDDDDDDVPGEVLNLLGEYGLRILAQLINNMCESGEWPKNFTKVRMTALKRQPKAAKCSNNRTNQPHSTYRKDSSKGT